MVQTQYKVTLTFPGWISAARSSHFLQMVKTSFWHHWLDTYLITRSPDYILNLEVLLGEPPFCSHISCTKTASLLKLFRVLFFPHPQQSIFHNFHPHWEERLLHYSLIQNCFSNYLEDELFSDQKKIKDSLVLNSFT